jgi:predicted naringenin-chalcone synthase
LHGLSDLHRIGRRGIRESSRVDSIFLKTMKKYSIEYAHIYTNESSKMEHEVYLSILEESTRDTKREDISLVVMVDDYSFPDPSFDYDEFFD